MKNALVLLLFSCLTASGQILPPNPVSLPFHENFESTSGIFFGSTACVPCSPWAIWNFNPANWTSNGKLDFENGLSNTSYGNQDIRSASMSRRYPNQSVPDLAVIGNLDMSGYDTSDTQSIILDFYHHYTGAITHDGLRVSVRGNSLNSWIQLPDQSLYAVEGVWVHSPEFNLSKLLKQNGQNFTTNFQMKFEKPTHSAIELSFDDIRMRQTHCEGLANVSFSVFDANVAVINPGETDLQSSFEYEYGSCGFSQGNGTTVSSTLRADTLTSLTWGGCYDFYVRKNCGAPGTFSTWTGPFSVRLNSCNNKNAPFYSGFESPVLTPCFSKIVYTSEDEIRSSHQKHYSGGRSIEIHRDAGSLITTTQLMLVSPRFIDLDSTKQISFFLSAQTSLADLVVGTLADPANPRTFSPYDTILASTIPVGGWQERSISFDQLTTTHQFIGLQSIGGNSSIYVDDLLYEKIPVCFAPSASSMSLDSISETTASVRWGAGGTGEHRILLWGPVGFDPQAGSAGSDTVSGTDSTYTITGLSLNSFYDWYLMDSCGTDSTSKLSGPAQFQTNCGTAPANLPFHEDFQAFPDAVHEDSVFQCSIGTNWAFGKSGGPGYLSSAHDTTGGFRHFSRSSHAKLISLGAADSIYLTLTLDLSNYINATKNIELSYFYANRLTSTNNDNRVWARGSASDPWIEISNWQQESQGWGWNKKMLYLDTALSAHGQSVSGSTQISWVKNGVRATNESGFGLDDVGVRLVSCPEPIHLSATDIADTAANLSWNSGNSSAQFQISISELAPQQTGTIREKTGIVTGNSLSLDTLSPGTCYKYLVRRICSTADTANWSEPHSFCTPCGVVPTPYSEDFDELKPGETGNLANCWRITTSNPTAIFPFTYWTNSGPTLTPYTGPLGDVKDTGTYVHLYSDGGAHQDTAKLLSPIFDLTGLPDPELAFSYHLHGQGNGNLLIDINDGSGWNNELLFIGSQQNSPADAWRDTSIDLSSYGSQIRIRFRSLKLAAAPLDISIDNISVRRRKMQCGEITSLQTDRIGRTEADISFIPGASDTSVFEVSYGAYLGNPDFGSKLTFTGDSVSLKGLNPGTRYCVYIREFCGTFADTGSWSAPHCFSTDCVPVSAPYFTNFDSETAPALPPCWEKVGSADSIVQMVTTTDRGVPVPSFPNAVEINNDISPSILATPILANLDSGLYQIRMMLHYEGADIYGSDTLFVGSIDASLNPSSFQYIDTLSNFDTVLQFSERIIELDKVPPTVVDKRIAFMHPTTIFEFYIDDFHYEIIEPCPAPGLLTTVGIGCDSITLAWDSRTGNSLLEYGPQGFSKGFGAKVEVQDTSLTLHNLLPGEAYDFYLADLCPGDTSPFLGPITFTTDTGPVPTGNIQILGDSISGGTKIFSLDASGSVDAETYLWIFGTNDTAIGSTSTAAYQTNGAKTITLITTNSCGSDTAVTMVYVDISLDENSQNLNLRVYPNPAGESVHVRFSGGGETYADLVLRDVTGRELKKIKLRNENGEFATEFDLNEISKGAYLLEVQTNAGRACRRLIKK